jgi:hypothetical protein
LVSGSLSVDGESERKVRSPFLTYTEQFYEVFPYYLSIGMTYEQFWDGDPTLAKHYRRADELKTERRNQELWLQGLYIYEALCDVAPIMHAMAKKGTKARPYPEQPYPITERQRRREIEEKEKAVANKGKRMMEMFMKQNNKQFEGMAQQDKEV